MKYGIINFICPGSNNSSNNDAGGMDFIHSYPAFRELESFAAPTIGH